MSIRIADNAILANEIANHPDIINYVSWTGETIDLQPLVDSDGCIIFENGDHGCFLLARSDYESYVVHTLFRRKTPSKLILETAKKAMWLSFIEHDVMELTSSACQTNPRAYRLMIKNGFKLMFESPSKFAEGKKERMCRLTIDEFIIQNEDLGKAGEEFHDLVEDTTDHADDPIHDRYVGAVISMVKADNIVKAERVYNKWAALAGYAPLSYDPQTNTITAGYMKIKITDDLQGIGGVSCQ